MMPSPSRARAATDRPAQAYPFVPPPRSRSALFAASLLAASVIGGAARAVAVAIALDPQTTRIAYTVFAYGLLPIPATYDRFTGQIAFDPAHAATCTVELSVDIGSLRMADPDHIRQALAPDMLDRARFPTMHYAGICRDHALVGTLTLHGVSRPVTLTATRDGDQLVATGTLRRRDYGIAGMSGLVGSQIRVRITTTIPAEAVASLKALP